MNQIIESVDMIIEKLDQLGQLSKTISQISDVTKESSVVSDLIPELGKLISHCESIKKRIAYNMQGEYAMNAIMEYYQAISETQIESHDLADLIRQIQNNAPDWGKMEVGSLENMKEQTINIRDRFSRYFARIKGRLASVGQSFKDALKSLSDEISGKLGDPIPRALRLVAEKFYEFIEFFKIGISIPIASVKLPELKITIEPMNHQLK